MDFKSQGVTGILYTNIVRRKMMRRKKRRRDTGSLGSCTLHSSGFGVSVLVLQRIDVDTIISI
jgi:hypothetical protein